MASELEKLLRKGQRRRKWPLFVLPAIMVFVGAFLVIDYLGNSPADIRGRLPRVINGGDAWNGTKEATAGNVAGRVTHVRDGDTIEIGRTAIRLASLDCAEKGTVAGDAATRRMKQIVRGQSLTCSLAGRKSYDREVGRCKLSDGRDIGQIMINNDVCKRWR